MSRNSSGTYVLPAGNPVVDGTVITPAWANPTLSDIAAQLNNVVTRDGLLGLTAPGLFVDGTISAPGIGFVSQASTGFYRTATYLAVTYSGVSPVYFASTGTVFTLPVTVLTPVNPFDASTKQYVDSLAFSTALPNQSGNANKFIRTNGTIATWEVPGISLVTTTTTSATLTSTPTLALVSPAATGVVITLPDATTVFVGGPLYAVRNLSVTFNIIVRDSAGNAVAILPPSTFALVYCTNNSTTAGLWVAGNQTYTATALNPYLLNTALVVNALSSNSSAITMLTTTRALLTYNNGAGNLCAVVLDITGASITAGPVLTTASTVSATCSLATLSASTAALAHITSGTTVGLTILVVTGTAVAATTTAAVASSAAGASLQLCVLSATKTVLAYNDSTSNFPSAIVLDIAGTVVTPGAAFTVLASAVTASMSVCTLSATTAFLGAGLNGAATNGYILTITGSVITAGAVFNSLTPTISCTQMFAVTMDSSVGRVLFTHANNLGNICATTFIVSGATATNISAVATTTLTTLHNTIVANTTTAVSDFNSAGTTLQSVAFKLGGNTLTVGTPVVLSTVNPLRVGLGALSENRYITAYSGPSGYINAAVQDAVL